MLTAPILKTARLVVGYSLSALQYAHTSGAMIIVNGTQRPHRLEKSNDHDEWHLLSYTLGLAGLSPIPSAVESIRIEKNVAHVATENYRQIKIHFDELYLFDLDCVEGLGVTEEVEEYLVYDWFKIRCGALQETDSLTTSNSFVKEVVFYDSERNEGSRPLKDCYSRSVIKAADLEGFESSGTAAKMATLKLIQEAGLRGSTRQINNTTHYLNVAIEHDRRDLYKFKKKYILNEELPSNVFCCNVEI